MTALRFTNNEKISALSKAIQYAETEGDVKTGAVIFSLLCETHLPTSELTIDALIDSFGENTYESSPQRPVKSNVYNMIAFKKGVIND